MRDRQKRILKASIIHIIVVTAIILASCNQQLGDKSEISEPRRSRENTRLMSPDRHSMMVPVGTRIGEATTYYDGVWLSQQACTNITATILQVEKYKKEALE